MAKYGRALVWLRRDLRLHDHVALAHACEKAQGIALVFVFDPQILKYLKKNDRRLTFIFSSLEEIDKKLREKGSRLILRYGNPQLEIPKIAQKLNVNIVYTNKDYEPYAKERDQKVEESLAKGGIPFQFFKDQVIFESREILTQTGGSFKVFTPYKNAWLAKLSTEEYEERKIKNPPYLKESDLKSVLETHDLETLGFTNQKLWLEPGEIAGLARLKKFEKQINDYKRDRDYPSAERTSGLSVHLRFGTVSIRDCVRTALKYKSIGSETWLSELIWRDFYQMILDQNPYVVNGSFKKECDKIRWPGRHEHFEAWCQGKTGFPIVDATMRHFKETGWMHNRLRMIVASFLTKDLLIDWRMGEKYFAEHLLDFDLAANNGGWQWSASTGCDAQPYFRVFNPYSQSEKFDSEGKFIRSQIPELKNESNIHHPEMGSLFTSKYPSPIVNHSVQREKAIALFKGIK